MTITCSPAGNKLFELTLPDGVQPPVVGDFVFLPGGAGPPMYRVTQRWWLSNGTLTLFLEQPPNPPR